MLKKFIRKGFAKMAVLVLVLSSLLPTVAPIANAGNISLRVGANLAGVTMKVYNFNQPNLFEEESDSFAPNQNGFRISGNIPGALTEDYSFAFDDMANYSVTFTANGQLIIDPFLANGKWFFSMEALPDNADMEVLADYQLIDQPQEQATINVAVNGPNNFPGAGVSITNNVANNDFIGNGANKNYVVTANGILDYTVSCQQINGFNLNINPNPAQFNNVQPNSVHNVTCTYTAQPQIGDGQVDFEVYTQDQQGNLLNNNYSYNGEPFKATPDAFSKNISDFTNLNKKVSFQPETDFTSPGEVTIVNRTINNIPANVNVYLNNFGNNYPQNYQFTENDKVIIVGTYTFAPQAQTATINVAVNGISGQNAALVSIFNSPFVNVPVNSGGNQDFNVNAPGNYSVVCGDFPGYSLITNNPIQVLNLQPNTTRNVECNYNEDATPTPEPATIHISVSGPNALANGIASISNTNFVNQAIQNGDTESFDVNAGQYTVSCIDVAGFDIVSNNPTQINAVAAGDYFVSCQYVAEPTPSNTATFNVTVNGPNSLTGAGVTISNTNFNNDFVANGETENYQVFANGSADYTVTCQQINGFNLSINPNPAQFNNVADGSVNNVTCTYVAVGQSTATIRVHVDGPGNFNGATVDITPNVTNNNFIADGDDESFNVSANGALDYTVHCDDVNGYTVQGGNNKAVNNINAGQTVDVYCTYIDEDSDTATIRVHVDGPNDMDEAEVDVTPNVANNFVIAEGSSHSFVVAANGVLDYTVSCDNNINGFDLTSNNPTQVNNIQPGSIVNVYCNYEDDNNSEDGTIRVHVNGPNDGDFEGAYISISPSVTNNNFIADGDDESFDVEAGEGQDYTVVCKAVSGYELQGNNIISVNNIDENETVNVYCNYGDGGETEVIQVSVDGPNGLDSVNVYIPGEFNEDIENGESENVTVQSGEDYLVYCERVPGYELTTDYPVEIDNINGTRNVVCRYEEDGLSTGFRIEVTPLQQYTYPGQQVTVTVRAINGSDSTVNDVELTHDYDQSKLRLLDADGGTNNSDYIRWDLGDMAAGEVESFTLRFQVTGQANETAQNNTRAITDEVNVDDIDNFVHIQSNVTSTPSTSYPTSPTTYVYPPTLFKSGTGIFTLLLASLATLGYGLVRYRKTIFSRLKAIRQAA